MANGRLFDFRRWALTVAALVIALGGNLASAEDEGASTASSSSVWVEGRHYRPLPVPAETRDTDRVEVVEVFSYMCPHCYEFDGMLENWAQSADPDKVSFRRVPAPFNPAYELAAQLFFIADVLDVSEAVHTPIFQALHDKRLNIGDRRAMAGIFEEYAGVPPEKFESLFNSFGVLAWVSDAKSYVNIVSPAVPPGRYFGVPSMVVNGKYLVDGTMAGGTREMLAVVDYLVAKESAEAAE